MDKQSLISEIQLCIDNLQIGGNAWKHSDDEMELLNKELDHILELLSKLKGGK